MIRRPYGRIARAAARLSWCVKPIAFVRFLLALGAYVAFERHRHRHSLLVSMARRTREKAGLIFLSPIDIRRATATHHAARDCANVSQLHCL
jgi:hypothetical protein